VPITQLQTAAARVAWVQQSLKDLEKGWGPIGDWSRRFEDEWLEYKEAPRKTAHLWLDSIGTAVYEGRALISSLEIALEGELPADVAEAHALFRQAFKISYSIVQSVVSIERHLHHCYGV
jgi:hypothetical protein